METHKHSLYEKTEQVLCEEPMVGNNQVTWIQKYV